MAVKKCQTCNGSGTVTQDGKKVTCPACNGAGGIDTTIV